MMRLVESTAEEALAGGVGPIPPAFILAAARYHEVLSDKAAVTVQSLHSAEDCLGWLVGVRRGTGRIDSLPDRMYGFIHANGAGPIDLDGVYKLLRREWGGSFRTNFPALALGGEYEGSHRGRVDRYHLSDTFLLAPESEDAARSAIRRVARQALQKAERGPLEVRSSGGASDWMQFLGLHVAKSARRGSPAMGRAEIRALQEVFGEGLGLHLATLEGRPVAAVVHVRMGAYAMMLDNASLPEHWGLNPNNLVVWTAMRDRVREGVKLIDLGFSAREDAGGHRFKEHMGGERTAVYSVTSG